MIPVSYYAPGETTSPKFAFAFAHGCGGEITDEQQLFPGPVALFGSPSRWPVLRQAQAEGRDWYYADHAYFGRGRFFRITKNAYQHDGRGIASPDRFGVFHKAIQPWQRHGRHIVLCPNSSVYFQLHGLDVNAWLQEVTATLKRYTDRPVIIRWKHDRRPITRDLINAWACVVYSSAAAIDALIAGVPVFVLAPFAAPARMGLSDLSKIEQPIHPEDRHSFLCVLAANQWTFAEMMDGKAWRHLQAEAA